MLKNLVFMIGAHKTASTHLQRSMVASSDALAAHDVAVVPPVPIGTNLLPLVNMMRDKADPRILQAAANKFLDIHTADKHTVLLMNENIPGTLGPNMLLADSKLYKFAPKRLKRFTALFPDHHQTVGLAIRNPATFLVSAWQETLKGNDFYPFEHYIKNIDLTALSWVQLINRMRNAQDQEVPFLVWRYEDYNQIRDQLVGLITSQDAIEDMVWLDETTNQGLSEHALNFLQAVGKVTKKNRDDAMELFPRGTDAPPFRPFGKAQLAELTELYDQQWAEIQAMPGVHTITP